MRLIALAAAATLAARPGLAQDTTGVRAEGDSVSVHFVDVDLRAVLQAMGRYLDRPVLFAGLPGVRVTLETPRPVSRAELLPLLRGVVESQNLDLVRDSAYYRVQAKQPPTPQMQHGRGPGQTAELQLTVIHLRHARAADVAATLSSLYGAGGADLGGGRPGTLSDELRRNLIPPAGAPQTPGQQAPAQASRGATLEGSVTIIPDPFTNALLIRATAHDAELLAQAVEQLDLRPLQVIIEVVIIEARKDYLLSWGLGWSTAPVGVGNGNATVQASQLGGGLSDFVLRVLNLSHAELNAQLQAGASRGNVNILSRPVLLAANNHDARILIGSQRPFVQLSRTLPTDNGSRDQIVQYKDVGTRLTVRPTISADGYVTLEVVQEVSNATTEQAFGAPVISTREAATQVTVRDGQTIVLGGLTDREHDVTNGGVPVLSDLPLLGGLFGRQSRQTTETELFLFLTPRVLRTDDEVDAATRDYQNRVPDRTPEPSHPQEPRP